MLVLTRKKGDVIDIEGVKVKVMTIKTGQVRIGIDAPDCVKICRQELIDRDKENEVLEK